MRNSSPDEGWNSAPLGVRLDILHTQPELRLAPARRIQLRRRHIHLDDPGRPRSPQPRPQVAGAASQLDDVLALQRRKGT
jgi:hypothetical protein